MRSFLPATSNILMSLPTISAAVKEPDGRVRKTSMPNLTGSTPSCSPSFLAIAASTSVAVGLLSMRVSVIMAESSSLAWVSVGATPMTSNSLATMEQEEPQGSATMCSGAAIVKIAEAVVIDDAEDRASPTRDGLAGLVVV